ncbi:site-specific DNA-methyltransferase [soil metagenome]
MSQHSAKFTELVKKLREIFQIDKPELDFGVYRILNARAGEINDYLENRLPEKIKAALDNGNASHKQQTARELQDKEAQYRLDGINPDSVPKVVELRQKLAAYTSGNAEHENAVFSHLLTFFSRYYDNGDFISQRRYKGDTYAIPYAGEEVMLHWANKDQYYTKSGENFSNYSFKLDDAQGGQRLVHCRLVAADTAKDNRKDNDKERRFALIEKKTVIRIDDDGDEYEEELIPVESIDQTVMENGVEVIKTSELILRFEYIPMPKGSKQADLTSKAVKTILADALVQAKWLDLGKRAPTEKDPQRTLLEKHLSDYTTKNTADYFIHKDLGGFLKRELDFYIKNEVMHLDDLQEAEKFADIEKNLRMIQCLRAIALELITFLAQLEDFQKKLWLKKKFVVSAHYCMTLDRVPEGLYPEIAANQKQWDAWEKLNVVSASNKNDLFSHGKTGTVEYLKEHLSLLVDTSFFSQQFKQKLFSEITDFDKYVDGVLVHGDNFQTLNLLQEKYREKVSSIYIDPPYNTNASEIAYKNGFKDSSWMSLINDRVKKAHNLLENEGMQCFTIDDYEVEKSLMILAEIFGSDNHMATVPVRNNPQGRSTVSGFSINHEYAIFHRKTEHKKNVGRLKRNEQQLERYDEIELDGRRYLWENFRKTGTDSSRFDRPRQFYPIHINKNGDVRVLAMEWKDETQAWELLEQPNDDEVAILPIDSSSHERCWKWGIDRATKEIALIKAKKISNDWEIYRKNFINENGKLPGTWWDDVGYSAGSHGTNLLTSLFGPERLFLFPKSVYAVQDCLLVSSNDGLVLDYFAGSGTTGHAVISLNRETKSNRKYILVEQGEYFETVTKPRIQKVVYSANWKDGKPTSPETGISHCFKVLKLESYEDTLNNLELQRSTEQGDLLKSMSPENRDDYLLRYMLDVESRGSLLPVEAFRKPFNVKLKVAVDSAGAFEERNIDLVETFNYLIGLTVKQMELALDRGYARIEGTLPSGENTLILWRDCERIGYEELMRYTERFDLNTRKDIFDVVYINGDHNIPTVLTATEEEGGTTHSFKLRQIEPEFLQKMFTVEDI